MVKPLRLFHGVPLHLEVMLGEHEGQSKGNDPGVPILFSQLRDLECLKLSLCANMTLQNALMLALMLEY